MAILQEGYDALWPILHHHEGVSCIEIQYLLGEGGKKKKACVKYMIKNTGWKHAQIIQV